LPSIDQLGARLAPFSGLLQQKERREAGKKVSKQVIDEEEAFASRLQKFFICTRSFSRLWSHKK
jgi:hypothetical protein